MMEAHARRGDPDTSHEAAIFVTPSLTHLQRQVMRYAKERGRDGFTDLEMEEALGNHGATYRTRRCELRRKKLIVDTGRRERNESDRCWRRVWAIAPLQ